MCLNLKEKFVFVIMFSVSSWLAVLRTGQRAPRGLVVLSFHRISSQHMSLCYQMANPVSWPFLLSEQPFIRTLFPWLRDPNSGQEETRALCCSAQSDHVANFLPILDNVRTVFKRREELRTFTLFEVLGPACVILINFKKGRY